MTSKDKGPGMTVGAEHSGIPAQFAPE